MIPRFNIAAVTREAIVPKLTLDLDGTEYECLQDPIPHEW